MGISAGVSAGIEQRENTFEVDFAYGGERGSMFFPSRMENHIQVQRLKKFGCFEPGTICEIFAKVREDDICWEIGARFGYFSLLMARKLRSPSQITAFEGNDLAHKILEKNNVKHLGGDMHMVKSWMGDEVGREVHSLSMGGTLFVNAHSVVGDPFIYGITGDEWVRTHDTPDFISMDVEGHELNILKGMPELLKAQPRIWLIEVHPEYIRDLGGTHMELIEILKASGYRLDINERWRFMDNKWVSVGEMKDFLSTIDGKYTCYMLRAER